MIKTANIGLGSALSDLSAHSFSLNQISRLDIGRAVSMAKRRLESEERTVENQESLKQFLFALFELWKRENGVIYRGALLGGRPAKPISELQRYAKLKKMDPWEAGPYGVNNPFELLVHIWSTNYREINYSLFLDCLAILILTYSDDVQKSDWWPAIISNSLRIAEFELERADIKAKVYLEGAEKLWSDAKAKREERKRLKKYWQSDDSLAERQRVKDLQARIINLADNFSKITPKPQIASKITRIIYPDVAVTSKEFTNKRRNIYRHLKHHPLFIKKVTTR